MFAAGVLDSGAGQLVAAAFIVDQNVEQYYKETIRHICQTIRRANDFAKQINDRAATASSHRTTGRLHFHRMVTSGLS